MLRHVYMPTQHVNTSDVMPALIEEGGGCNVRRGKCRALSLCLRRVVWSHVRVCRRGTPPVHPRKLPVSRDGGLSAILRASARRRSAKKRVRRVARPAGAFFYQGPRLCVAVRDNATDTELASSHRRCSKAL